MPDSPKIACPMCGGSDWTPVASDERFLLRCELADKNDVGNNGPRQTRPHVLASGRVCNGCSFLHLRVEG